MSHLQFAFHRRLQEPRKLGSVFTVWNGSAGIFRQNPNEVFFHLKHMTYVAGFCYSCFHALSVAHFYTAFCGARFLLKE